MYWLAINREPVTMLELLDDIITLEKAPKLIETLESLMQRSLIEKARDATSDASTFTLQNVVMEYITDRFIEQIITEINQGKFELFNTHAIIKATTSDYIRSSQIRLILNPILYSLSSELKRGSDLLQILRNQPEIKSGYATGNIINLLVNLKINLNGYDFSELVIKQAYLQGVNLRLCNFSNSSFDKCIFTQPFGSIQSVAFSPNGQLAASDTNGQIILWQVADSKHFLSLKAHLSWVWSVGFSCDGSIFASGSSDHTICLWRLSDGQLIKTLQGHTAEVNSVVFSPNGKTLASASNDGTLKLWSTSKGECIKTLRGHAYAVQSVVFSPDGRYLISAGTDETIKLWNIRTGECVKTLEGHIGVIWSVAINQLGAIIASGSQDETIKLWDINTGECLNTQESKTSLRRNEYNRSQRIN